MNYLYSLLEAEARLAASAMGLDPGLGVLHTDTTARDSLACDLMEQCRADVDAYLLDWITRQPLDRRWFFEQRNGNCRLMAQFAARLSETVPTWRRAVAPVAEWVARAFWSTLRKPDAPLATRLTQTKKREAKGGAIPPLPPAPQPQNVCLGCGNAVAKGSTHCATCSVGISRERMFEIARRGRVVAHEPRASARRRETKRRHDLALRNWSPSDQPDWLTDEMYANQIQPRLRDASLSEIASAIGVSILYASDIRRGRRRPHPRHWQALAELVGVSNPP